MFSHDVPGYDVRLQHDFAAVTDLYAKVFDVDGPRWVVSTACSSSGKVLGTAQRLIAHDLADAVLVGGIDSLCRMTLRGFTGLGIYSSQPARPFAADRDGIHIGEGAALLLVERDGDAPVWLLGVGESADAYQMSTPDPGGLGARSSLERALAQAGLAPSDVDLVLAHGTATRLNDASEARSIGDVFGANVPVASSKGATGHLLGAAGATTVVFAAHAIRASRIPGTPGAEPVDPEVAARIHVSTRSAPGRVRRVVASAFAFGGSNVSVLVGAQERPLPGAGS
jgi:3-oxoacyl-[acyl-carrier-protein] synthase-1